MIPICEAAHEVVFPPGQAYCFHVAVSEIGLSHVTPARLRVKVHVVDTIGV